MLSDGSVDASNAEESSHPCSALWKGLT
jgi:hypothetical protein